MSEAVREISFVPGTPTLDEWTKHSQLKEWIKKQVELCKPDRVHLCTGSEEENKSLLQQLVLAGTLTPLSWPGCYLARSTTADVARVESRTFICSKKKEDAGPTNNWEDPDKMMERLGKLFDGCMKGRTLYAIPFSMGPVGSPLSAVGVQLTDSAYAVANMRIMTRMGTRVLEVLGSEGRFVPAMHTLGAPLKPGKGPPS